MQSLASQFYAFIVTVLIGVTIGVIFDIYRVTKGIIRPRKVFVCLGDLLFWVISTFIVFFMLLLGNWGEIRLYVLVGMATGALIYIKTASRLVIRFLLGLFNLIKKAFALVLRILRLVWFVVTYPVILVRNIIIIPIGYLGTACTRASGFLGRLAGRLIIGPVKCNIDSLKNRVKRRLNALIKK